MFIIVLTLEISGITNHIADILNRGNTILVYGISSTLVANLLNNIPMSVLYSTLAVSNESFLPATYSAIIGSNIGAYITPIGALAGIMWLKILKSKDVKFGFGKYIVYGTIVAPPTLISALLGLWLVQFLGVL
jgi:arsenical pump membrane protein